MASIGPDVLGNLSRRFDLSERVGILAGSTSVGQSFNRGLLTRSTTDQAIITGSSAAVNYGLTAFAHSVAQGLARTIVGRKPETLKEHATERTLVLAADLVAAAAGIGVQRAFQQRRGEPIARAWTRNAAWRLTVSGACGAVIIGAELALEAIDPTEGKKVSRSIPVALPIGAAVAAVQYRRMRADMTDKGVTTDAEGMEIETDPGISTGRAIGAGVVVSAGLVALATGEKLLANGVAYGVRGLTGGDDLVAKPVGHLVGLGIMAGGGVFALREVMKRAEHTGDAVEAAYTQPPTSAFVSGGPNSLVSWEDVGREGRRFTRMALTREEIETVMGEPAVAEPVRAFVGLESAATTNERADLAMRELEQLGGLERSLIVFASPTGTGYLNYVTAEAIEYLTRGDCAIVAMQYSLRPSPLSLNRVQIGVQQNTEFLHALKWRLEAIPEDRRPRLVIFGESLGAQTSEDVFKDEGVAGFHRAGIDRGLFLGTPYATKWRLRWLADKDQVDPEGIVVEVNSPDDLADLPQDQQARARFYLLTHYNDPMPKFWFPLAVQAPEWMGPPETREPGLPKETLWRPYTTFLITFIDVKNAMHVIPGKFVAHGHDYRKDLARMVSTAYDLPIDPVRMETMERALREREFVWAQRRLVSEQVAGAEAKMREQLEKWGVPSDQVPTILASSKLDQHDPFAVAGLEAAAV